MALKLSSIFVSISSSEEKKKQVVFDKRNHFALKNIGFYKLSTLLVFENACFPNNGCRQKVSVELIDADGNVKSSSVRHAAILANRKSLRSRISIPFIYNNVECDTEYTILVRDFSSREILGKKIIRVYNLFTIGRTPERWYGALDGGIIPEWSFDTFKCIKDVNNLTHKLRFKIFLYDSDIFKVLPELEMKIYFPNRIVETRFIEPRKEENSVNSYNVETSLKVDYLHWGNCYVKLLCMNQPIAGFPFGTTGPNIAGEWRGSELTPIKRYSGKIAGKIIKDTNPFNFKLQDELDCLLQEFIDSQKDM